MAVFLRNKQLEHRSIRILLTSGIVCRISSVRNATRRISLRSPVAELHWLSNDPINGPHIYVSFRTPLRKKASFVLPLDIENGKKDVASLSEKEEMASSTNHHLNNLANRIKDKIAVRLYTQFFLRKMMTKFFRVPCPQLVMKDRESSSFEHSWHSYSWPLFSSSDSLTYSITSS